MKKRLCVAALGLVFVVSPTLASDNTVSVQETNGSLSWSTQKAYGTANLVISGPSDFLVQRTFEDGEPISHSMFDDFAIEDGSYTWSLTVVSPINNELRARMDQARAEGDRQFTTRLKESGDFYSHTFTGAFAHRGGVLVVPGAAEILGSHTDIPTKDQVTIDDLIVKASACFGFDCVDGEVWGFDTIRLKENNVRIKLEDTSSSSSFPSVDWQLTANDSANGGLNRFSIEDITNTKSIFTIEADAPANSLYVKADGDVGINTSQPVINLHIKGSDTPGIRLEQDSSVGWPEQKWDISGNDVNFFIRDNGARLPFRIYPGLANNNTLTLSAAGNVGAKTTTPDAPLHAVGAAAGSPTLLVDRIGDGGVSSVDATAHLRNDDGNLVLRLTGSSSRTQMELENTAAGQTWRYDVNAAGKFTIVDATGTSVNALQIDPNTGNTMIAGTLTAAVGGTNLMFPDYVFEDDYDLMPLDELAAYIETEGHLPKIEKAESVEARGNIDMSKLQLQLLEKIEELTLYTLAQQETIDRLEQRLNELTID